MDMHRYLFWRFCSESISLSLRCYALACEENFAIHSLFFCMRSIKCDVLIGWGHWVIGSPEPSMVPRYDFFSDCRKLGLFLRKASWDRVVPRRLSNPGYSRMCNMPVTSQRRYAPRSVCHNADMQHALYVTKKYTPCSIGHQKIYTMLYMSQKAMHHALYVTKRMPL